MILDRRQVLAGGVAALLPVRAWAADGGLRALLDRATTGGPGVLAGADRLVRSEGDRLDLSAARAGLAIDGELLRRFGKAGAPYRVTARSGAWSAARPDATAIARETVALRADADAGTILPQPSLDMAVAALRGAAGGGDPLVAAAMIDQADALDALRPRAPATAGLAAQPGGAARYRLLLQRTLGAVEPAEGERRIRRRHDALVARADRLLRQVGYREGPVAARFARLWADPRHLYADDDAGRAAAVADMNRVLAGFRARVPAAFGALPGWCLDGAIATLSPAEMAAGRQGYRRPPAPGRPFVYVADLKDMRRRPRFTLPSVVAHEGLPGHMIQLGLEGATPPHPLRLTYAAAFVEGWGVHAEVMADRAGAFADPLVELGHVHWLLFRTGRALADLGIHLHGWTMAEARARLAAWQGVPAYFAPFDLELERIAIEPATRAAEALAWLAIEDASAQAGGSVAFNRALMDAGRRRTEGLPGI